MWSLPVFEEGPDLELAYFTAVLDEALGIGRLRHFAPTAKRSRGPRSFEQARDGS